MSQTVWKPHAVVASVIEKDERFLLVEELSRGKAVLNQPAGHLEDGENYLDAVVRETLEETTWQFEPQAIVGIYRWRHRARKMTHVRVTYCGSVSKPLTSTQRDPEIIDTHWLSLKDIEAKAKQHRSPLVLQCIYDYLDGKRFPLELITEIESH